MDSHSNDMELIIPKGCDNAPRKKIVLDFTIAVLTGESGVVEEWAHEKIVWHHLKDDEITEGLSSLLSLCQKCGDGNVERLEIDQVLTHGKFAAINGIISYTDDSSTDFCDVYTFSNAAKSGKVKEVKSYRL